MSLAKAELPNRNYEGVVILHPDVNEEQQKAFFKKSSETIKSFKGRVNHIDTWGKRRLGNPIKKMKLGSYFHITFEAAPACVNELERTMRIDERVLRFTHMKLDDRVTLTDHVEKFKNSLIESNKREQEREAKRDLRRREGGPGRGGDRGGDRGGPRRNESRPGGRFGSTNRFEDGGDDSDIESGD
jgi:small subunit ribosomal protein S6